VLSTPSPSVSVAVTGGGVVGVVGVAEEDPPPPLQPDKVKAAAATSAINIGVDFFMAHPPVLAGREHPLHFLVCPSLQSIDLVVPPSGGYLPVGEPNITAHDRGRSISCSIGLFSFLQGMVGGFFGTLTNLVQQYDRAYFRRHGGKPCFAMGEKRLIDGGIPTESRILTVEPLQLKRLLKRAGILMLGG
jgi:hypothetical protein